MAEGRAEDREKVAEGRAEGREKVAEGRAEGREEGDRDRAIKDARNLLREGVTADAAARAIGLFFSEVNALEQA